MAEDKTPRDLMRYDLMAQDALRGVVREALKRAASPKGIPGDHHFYISFQTRASGVSVPPELLQRYPDEMTIVLQHEFWELEPGETAFSVVLHFGGQPKKLALPYAAITRFHDPSVPFALQFEPSEIEATPPPRAAGPTSVPTLLSPVAAAPARARPTSAEDGDDEPPLSGGPTEGGGPTKGGGPAKGDGPKIVSLDQFRKK